MKLVAYNVLSAIFRGLGDSRSPLIFVAVACVVNVIGDLILVAGFHLDAAGAAIATVLAQAFSVPLAYIMSIQPDASLTNIGLAAPIATCFGIVLNVIFFFYMTRNMAERKRVKNLQ